MSASAFRRCTDQRFCFTEHTWKIRLQAHVSIHSSGQAQRFSEWRRREVMIRVAVTQGHPPRLPNFPAQISQNISSSGTVETLLYIWDYSAYLDILD